MLYVLELFLNFIFHLNTVNLSDKIIIIKKLSTCKRISHVFDRSMIFTLSYVGYLPQSIVEPRLSFVKIKQLRFAYLEGIELSVISQTSGSVLTFRSLGN